MFGVATPTARAISATLATSASSSTGRPASTSCSIDERNAPSLRVIRWRSSGVVPIGRPMRAPTAAASRIVALTKSRTSGSSMIRSVVAPVIAEIGLIVMLPHSLNQTSCWMRGESSASKPACAKSAAMRSTRALLVPSGSPKIRRFPLA